ncbi:glutamyl-tRNA(Gln) amidotransferase subunit A [Gaeumannomyces tritici R3-111a-1]|uniref:Glutamyl-tRNA(Gln) amidotransferase subunit A n=1 Tax=Gaeumannomyces tritici (strain R3-111a-1) TaxID=644352 RepID=J3P194_GAET3|nr:glutamyl-tRNA(Gln) amidotransferase subunit A [Gaeumannomyces tritici R3-111a-1]EJT77379.1 glutamyl-tRNA(Gln) amidotransferase subunit A [Gaeumannomyces tritici R3-111a-1]
MPSLNHSSLLLLATWLCAALAALQPNVTVKGHPFPRLIDATLDDLARGLEEGLFTSVDLVMAYTGRIGEANARFRAVTELNPDAIAVAAELDAERAAGRTRGPLHGVPVLIKNNIATADAMNNTAGSYALLGAVVPRDSFVAARLRAAGAVILGKANLSQWANYRSMNSTNGWSAHGGQVMGAYHERQDPSGSSSGSAVASALGLAWAALGTETDGSILSPSSVGSLVGIKPTVGLTSRDLVIPISEHQDTVGPMARTVRDAARLLQAIAGVDANDNYTSAIPGGAVPDYAAACDVDRHALGGARIGFPLNVLELYGATNGSDPELAAFEAALALMEAAGATIVRGEANFTAAAEQSRSDSEMTVLNADFTVNLASYLSKLSSNPSGVKSLQDVRRFTQQTAPELEAYPDRDTAIWDVVLDRPGFNNTDPRAWAAYQKNLYFGGEGGLVGAISRNRLDAVVLPTLYASSWAAINGAPVVTVPLGYYPPDWHEEESQRGLIFHGPNIPFGISFLGAHWTEEKLIGLAYDFEQRTQVRDNVAPFAIPSTEIGDVAGY